MSNLSIKGTRLLNEMLATDKRFILSVGGARSSKTFSILQYILIYCFKHTGKIITIARATMPSLRIGAMREFINMLKEYGLYRESAHNKTNNYYTLNNNTVQFISIDQAMKLRGLQHDLVFIDECNEITYEEAQSIFMRTNGTIILAQNPSNALHWSLKLKDKDNCLYLHSTFKDNPFLDQNIINQIKSYEDVDDDLWRIFGLGLPSKNSELIYSHNKPYTDKDLFIIDEDGEKHPVYEEIVFGLDLGFNAPTSLVKIYINSTYKRIWCEEMIYESYLTTSDLIQKMKQMDLGDHKIYCDSAEPKTIEEIRRAGFDIVKANKEVNKGIDCVKSCQFYVHSNSSNIQKELRLYKWKMKNEVKTDDVIKMFDHSMDAVRYGVYTYLEHGAKVASYDFDMDIISFE